MLAQALPQITAGMVGLLFLEGLLAFVSPCILPMLPVYLVYLSGSKEETCTKKQLVANTVGFILGFTLVFVLLGATASGIGRLFAQHKLLLQRISGGLMVLFGLHFTGLLRLPFLNQSRQAAAGTKNLTFFTSLLFGFAFSFGWTPCLGPLLGSALLFASNAATLWEGVLLLLVFSLGLGVPFLLSALLWNRLQGVLGFVKKHLHLIKIISGIVLILVGLLFLFDLFGYYQGLFV
ncbi:MAG: cytochrome c biogenesis CcdA family protein [Oscillospiraceae bacterium]